MNQYIFKKFELIFKNQKLDDFTEIDISVFRPKQRELLDICKELVIRSIPISAESIFAFSGKEMLLIYIDIYNQIDKKKYLTNRSLWKSKS